jgi:hypothetical protein
MANTCKSLTVDRIEDMTLGVFGNLRPSETLNHLIRYLSTWSGSEYGILSLPLPITVLTSITVNCSW